MANILTIAETKSGGLKKSSFEIISLAKSLTSEVHSVLIGQDATKYAGELAKYGADVIYTNDNKGFSPLACAKAIAELVKEQNFDIVLLSHTNTGKEIGARLSALLDAGMISEAVEVNLN